MSAVTTEASRGRRIIWSWSHWLLYIMSSCVPVPNWWRGQNHHLQQQCLLFTAEPPFQPVLFCFLVSLFCFGFFPVVFFIYLAPVPLHLWFSGIELMSLGYGSKCFDLQNHSSGAQSLHLICHTWNVPLALSRQGSTFFGVCRLWVYEAALIVCCLFQTRTLCCMAKQE